MFYSLWLIPFVVTALDAQDPLLVYQTFKDTRVINAHSVETLQQGELDFRVGHRFGDILGDAGGWETFYGLENASDVYFGFEYGISDRFTLGLNRSKGSGPLKQNISGLVKYNLVQQSTSKSISLVFLALATGSTMPSSANKGALNYFAKTAHRFSYHSEIILGRKFSPRFSAQLNAGITYRNIVPSNDINELPSVGAATRIQLSKPFALLLEGRYVIAERGGESGAYHPSYGLAIEWETGGGHVFQMNVVNSGGMVETDYIPYTTQDASEGEFRLGFTISRLFRI